MRSRRLFAFSLCWPRGSVRILALVASFESLCLCLYPPWSSQLAQATPTQNNTAQDETHTFGRNTQLRSSADWRAEEIVPFLVAGCIARGLFFAACMRRSGSGFEALLRKRRRRMKRRLPVLRLKVGMAPRAWVTFFFRGKCHVAMIDLEHDGHKRCVCN